MDTLYSIVGMVAIVITNAAAGNWGGLALALILGGALVMAAGGAMRVLAWAWRLSTHGGMYEPARHRHVSKSSLGARDD